MTFENTKLIHHKAPGQFQDAIGAHNSQQFKGQSTDSRKVPRKQMAGIRVSEEMRLILEPPKAGRSEKPSIQPSRSLVHSTVPTPIAEMKPYDDSAARQASQQSLGTVHLDSNSGSKPNHDLSRITSDASRNKNTIKLANIRTNAFQNMNRYKVGELNANL